MVNTTKTTSDQKFLSPESKPNMINAPPKKTNNPRLSKQENKPTKRVTIIIVVFFFGLRSLWLLVFWVLH